MILKKCCGVYALRIAVGIMMLGLLLVGSANASTFTVCPSGCAYSSIQKAIKASSNGDTILVKSGTYLENVNVTKQIILHGIGNPIVDARGSGSAITLDADGITLEGFTATGSGGYYDSPVAGIKVTSSNNTLRGNNASNNRGFGIYLESSSNNTLGGNNISNNDGYFGGIGLSSSSNNTLSGNNASKNNIGISLSDSSNNNKLSGNNASKNGISGISLSSSSKNTLTDNNASKNNIGISLSSSSKNTLSGNKANWNNYGSGISLSDSSNSNKLSGNNASKNDENGILLWYSNNNTLTGNNASNNGKEYVSGKGISLSSSSKNVLINNIMKGNNYNFGLEGSSDSDFDNQIDTSNLVDGKPVYYIHDVTDRVYDSSTNAGTFYCISCMNVTLKNLDLKNNGNGIIFWNTTNSKIQNVNALNNNNHGISLGSSSNNTLTGNNATSNNWNGIRLYYSSNNTLIGNKASNNNYMGISLSYSHKNTLISNNASNNGKEYGSGDSGISLSFSSKNVLINNIMKGNNYNFGLEGSSDSDFDNQIDTNNLVDGKNIYYIQGVTDKVYDSSTNAGTFYCISCVNVTLKNLNLNNNSKGIFFWNTSQSRIQNVNASNNQNGISLGSSSNNTLNGNNANSNKNGVGISLGSSSNNTMNENNASNNGIGIILYDSSKNTLNRNNALNNNDYGIFLESSSNKNTLNRNNASKNNLYGIFLESSSKNILTRNNASKNKNCGVSFSSSSKNTLTRNNASKNNYYGIFLGSSSKNTLNGNNASNNGDSGIYLSSSSNNTMSDNNAKSNIYGSGISLSDSSKNTLTRNNALKNRNGIYLKYSGENTLIGNNASYNNISISLKYSFNNKIYNNIFNDINNVKLSINAWNTTRQSGTNIIGGSFLGGNFWVYPNGTGFSQTCKDGNSDGICDRSYILDEKNIDYLPLSMNFTTDKIHPKSVSNLKNVSYASSYINWTWKDPKDVDFNKVMVFIDDKFKKNVSKGKRYYNATNFKANTRHTISTWTVDSNGNINKTWTNSSAWTAK